MSVTALAYDPSGKKIYAVGQGNLSVIDVATGVQEQLFALPNARHNEAVFGGGKLYIVNAEDDSFSIYDPEQNSMRPAINISVGPRSVAVTPNGKHLVVCHPDQLKVSIIDTEQPSSPPVIFNGQGAYMDVEVSRDGELMYFTNYSRWRVDAIELSNPQNRKTYSLGMDLYRVGVALDSRQLYASTVEGGLYVLDTVTGDHSVMEGIRCRGGLVMSTDGRPAYVGAQSEEGAGEQLVVIDTVANSIVKRLDTRFVVNTFAVNPDGNSAVLSNGTNIIHIIPLA